MKPSNRPPTRGSVGKGGGPWFPEETTYSDISTAVEDPESDWSDPNDPWAAEDDHEPSLGERLDMWRRKYLPLPDEVVHEFLGEDEYVVHSDHPSFRAFLEKNIAFVVLIPIMGPIVVWFVLNEINIWTIGIFLFLDVIVAVLALRRLNDRYTSYVITNLRLIKVTGIISRKLVSIPWTRMTGLGYTQKALGRLLGYATIFIESANEESGLREFSDVNDPQTFHQRLLDMVSAKSGQSNRPPPAPTVGKRRSFMTKHKERKQAAEAGVSPKGFAGDKRVGPAPGSTGSTPGRPKAGGTGEAKGRPKVPGSGGSGKAVGPSEPRPAEGSRPRSGPEPDPEETAPEAEPAPAPVATETEEPEEATGEEGPPEAAEAGEATEPEPMGSGSEEHRRSWLRWPGSDVAGREPPVPASPGQSTPAGSAGTAKRRQPDQRAPSKRPPETIVVPKARRTPGQPKRGPKSRTDSRWQGRVREIKGYKD